MDIPALIADGSQGTKHASSAVGRSSSFCGARDLSRKIVPNCNHGLFNKTCLWRGRVFSE
jgi:hypothetical protein